MRFIYIDEAGTSLSLTEPVAVVVGVIIDGDRQFRAIESYVHGLIEKYVPEEKRSGFVFHAKELANGGKTFPKSEPESRLAALRDMAALPGKFMLPIVFGYDRKTPIAAHAQMAAEQRAALLQAVTYSQCATAAERYMREFARRDEVAICVAEDNPPVHRAVKAMHKIMSDPKLSMLLPEPLREYLPIGRIIDTVHFAAKRDAVLLQIADVCAYVLKRYLARAKYASSLFALMTNGNGPAPETFDHAAGHYVMTQWLESKVASGEAWLVSPVVQSSRVSVPLSGVYFVPRHERQSRPGD